MKEVKKLNKDEIRDKIRGTLIGGAAGDALGYPVEFMNRSEILKHFGADGITSFVTDRKGKALVSDDTQMTLFTANGMLMGATRCCMRGIGSDPERYTQEAYCDWYYTQMKRGNNENKYTWLRDIPEMNVQRAPGITCLNACEDLINRREVKNNSKGCGGIMRVAPMALFIAAYNCKGVPVYSIERMDIGGANIAAMTHKHPLGFLPAAALTHLLYKLITDPSGNIKSDIVKYAVDAVDTVSRIYKEEYDKYTKYLSALTHKAILLAGNHLTDAENISELGNGWVAEETWAIALYCAIRHADSPEAAIIASVNHDGDSDSTGSVCGNIMGAIYGYNYLRKHRIFCPEGKCLEETLELHNIILAIADDLTSTCIIFEYDLIDTPEKKQWYERYCLMNAVNC